MKGLLIMIIPISILLSPASGLLKLKETPRIKLGVFDGRTPCSELTRLLEEKTSPDCIKLKWRLTLFVDSISKEPSGYELIGFAHERRNPRKGTWKITKGMFDDPDAEIYELYSNDKPTIFLLRGDENVLFFLSDKKKLLVGNYDFSYALNKVK